jgi:TolA-binding protein
MKDGQCVLEKAETEPEPPKVTPPAAATDYESAIDPRRRPPRTRALLIAEVQSLEALFASTAKNSPDRPRIVRRLAEEYVELADSAAAESVAAQMPADIAKALKIEQAARTAAVKYYTVLHSEYPSFCQSVNAFDPTKSTGCDDEVLYFDALEYRRLKRMDDSRKKLLELIQHYPGSKYTGPSYFIFGELFRNDATVDPTRWPLAEQSYTEAAKYPNTPTTRPALYRLAEVYENQGNKAKALSTLAKARAMQPQP